jgi:hypothetical protein
MFQRWRKGAHSILKSLVESMNSLKIVDCLPSLLVKWQRTDRRRAIRRRYLRFSGNVVRRFQNHVLIPLHKHLMERFIIFISMCYVDCTAFYILLHDFHSLFIPSFIRSIDDVRSTMAWRGATRPAWRRRSTSVACVWSVGVSVWRRRHGACCGIDHGTAVGFVLVSLRDHGAGEEVSVLCSWLTTDWMKGTEWSVCAMMYLLACTPRQ